MIERAKTPRTLESIRADNDLRAHLIATGVIRPRRSDTVTEPTADDRPCLRLTIRDVIMARSRVAAANGERMQRAKAAKPVDGDESEVS